MLTRRQNKQNTYITIYEAFTRVVTNAIIIHTRFFILMHSALVKVSALAITGTMLTLRSISFMKAISSGFNLFPT